MIRRALSALAGPLLPYAAGAVGVLLIALGAAWQVQSWRLDAAQARVADLRGELDTAKAALADRETMMGALERQAEAVESLRGRLDPVRREIHAAPRTTACVASPVVVRGLERLRAGRPAPPGAEPRAVAPDLPARAGGA